MSPEKDPAMNLEYARGQEDEVAELSADIMTDQQWQEFAPGRKINLVDESTGPEQVIVHAKTAGQIMMEQSSEIVPTPPTTFGESPFPDVPGEGPVEQQPSTDGYLPGETPAPQEPSTLEKV